MVITGAPRKRLGVAIPHVGSNPTLSANSPVPRSSNEMPSKNGEMTEWLKVLAWKACVRQRTVGSNPTLSARIRFAGPKPCALQSREFRQARKGATVSESLQVPQVYLGPNPFRPTREML